MIWFDRPASEPSIIIHLGPKDWMGEWDIGYTQGMEFNCVFLALLHQGDPTIRGLAYVSWVEGTEGRCVSDTREPLC